MIPPIETPNPACFARPVERRKFERVMPVIVGTAPRTITQNVYWLAKVNVSSLAPNARRIGVMKKYIAPEKIPAEKIHIQKQNDDTDFASSSLFAPIKREIRVPPPIPKRFANVIDMLKTGSSNDTPATIRGLLVRPIKNVSARL